MNIHYYWPFIQSMLLVGLVVIVPTAFVLWIKRREARATRNPEIEAEYRSAGIELTTSRTHGGRVARGMLDGLRFSIEIVPGSRSGGNGAWILATPTPLAGTFEAIVEGGTERYFKRIGLSSEVQTGDAGFDREVYLSSGASDFLESLFGKVKARDAVRELFRLGYHRVALGGGVLRAYRAWRTQLPDLATLRPALGQLAALGATTGVRAGTARVPAISSTALIIGVSAVLLLGGFFLLNHAAWSTQPFADGAAAMLGMWPAVAAAVVALAMLAVRFLRGRPQAHAEIGFIIFAALPGLCLGGYGAAMLANQHLDESASRERHAKVDGRDYSRKLRSPMVVLAPLRAGGGRVNMPVSAGTHKILQKGQPWTMRTRAGWLGYEWVESAQPAPDAVKPALPAPRSR